MVKSPKVKETMHHYQPLLPSSKDARILELGFGDGWFIAAAIGLGYKDITAADFVVQTKAYMKDWSTPSITLDNINTSIMDYLDHCRIQYDFIHISHLIEHIPKYDLIEFGDILYRVLKPQGTLMVRCPNMDGPGGLSARYVTLGHEVGFCGGSLTQILEVCNFDQIKFLNFSIYRPTLTNRLSFPLRKFFVFINKLKLRYFGAGQSCARYESELVATARRMERPVLAGRLLSKEVQRST